MIPETRASVRAFGYPSTGLAGWDHNAIFNIVLGVASFGLECASSIGFDCLDDIKEKTVLRAEILVFIAQTDLQSGRSYNLRTVYNARQRWSIGAAIYLLPYDTVGVTKQ